MCFAAPGAVTSNQMHPSVRFSESEGYIKVLSLLGFRVDRANLWLLQLLRFQIRYW